MAEILDRDLYIYLQESYYKRIEIERLAYLHTLQSWYPILNDELFGNKLSPIRIEVDEEFYFQNGSAAQYRIPKGSAPYLCFNLDALRTGRYQFVEGYIDDYEYPPTDSELCNEVKCIIAGNLIHEMIHQYARENDIRDAEIIDGIDYHLDAFREIAIDKGLLVLPDFNGQSNTHIQPNHPVLDKLEYDEIFDEDLDEILDNIGYYDDKEA